MSIKSKEHFHQTIPISSFKFESFKNSQQVSLTEMKTMFKISRHTRIVASIDDFRRFENPLESIVYARRQFCGSLQVHRPPEHL
jgi:hypothetical protein